MDQEKARTLGYLLAATAVGFFAPWAMAALGFSVTTTTVLGTAAVVGGVVYFTEKHIVEREAEQDVEAFNAQRVELVEKEVLAPFRAPEREATRIPDTPHHETYWQDQLQEERQTHTCRNPLLH